MSQPLGKANLAPELESYRKDFPLLSRYPELSYLDSSSTTQKPKIVIDAINEYYETSNANAHRGVYKISELSNQKFEGARIKVANFLGADSEEEIIFTRGTTEAINLVAYSFLRPRLSPGDTIVLGGAEHHANIVPWQIVANERGAKIEYINVLDSGELDLDHFQDLLKTNPKIISLAQVSNILGTINSVEEIIKLAQEKEIPVLIDGAQSASHLKVNLKQLGCDFYTFSGHKAYGPMGIGALYVKKVRYPEMVPFLTGGGMIQEVDDLDSTYIDAPYKFEAGTQSIADAYAMGVALDYIENIGIKNIQNFEMALTEFALTELRKISGINILGPKQNHHAPIISFNVDGLHPHDLATILDNKNVAVRAGHHCSQHTMRRFNINATVRASFGLYNNKKDIDQLIIGINHAKSIFKVR